MLISFFKQKKTRYSTCCFKVIFFIAKLVNWLHHLMVNWLHNLMVNWLHHLVVNCLHHLVVNCLHHLMVNCLHHLMVNWLQLSTVNGARVSSYLGRLARTQGRSYANTLQISQKFVQVCLAKVNITPSV